MTLRAVLCFIAVAGVTAGRVQAAASDDPTPMGRIDGSAVAGAGVSPVDVVYPRDLMAQGYTTLPEVLANLLPSFVYPQSALADFTSHMRPSSLRGLAPDQMVVLLNGKRRNPSAWLHRGDTFGRGSVGVDLSVIPLAAVKRIEILRDGASARYGSGAIGGVINVVLDDADQGGNLWATYGQYRTHMTDVPDLSEFGTRSSSEFFLYERGDLNTDDGDGDTSTVSAHGGFTLFDRGFVDLTAELRDQEPTNRSGFDPRAIYPALPNGDFDPREALVNRRTYRYGNPQQKDAKLLTNFGMPVGRGMDFYGHIGYTAHNAESSDDFVLARSDANVPTIHSDGYRPLLVSDNENRYFSFGLRGEDWGWSWDVSFTQDEYEMDMKAHDSLNASLGDISPTSFSLGNFEGRHAILALDVARDMDVGLAGPLALTWGLEVRQEEYENEFGDRASYISGGATNDSGELRPPGSQGFYGVRPVDDFDDSLTDRGAYLQVEAPFTGSVSVLAGLRYDDEDAGSNLSARLGGRWQATDRFSLRAAASRNFRNPSAAQTYLLDTTLAVMNGGYRVQGIYPADDPAARALGAQPLDSETALDMSAGAEYQFNETASLSLNVYRIDVDDRVVLSDLLSGATVTDALTAAGISDVAAARYFFNGVDTRTQGIDLAGRYRWQSPIGPVDLRAGLNVNDVEVTGTAATPAVLAGADSPRFGPRLQAQLESATPDSKLHLSARWEGERLWLDVRVLRYGEVTDVGPVPEQDLNLGSHWLMDVHGRYWLTDHGYLTVGVNNVFDEYTEVRSRTESDPALNQVLPYSNYSPYGFNGRFAYLRLGYDLTR